MVSIAELRNKVPSKDSILSYRGPVSSELIPQLLEEIEGKLLEYPCEKDIKKRICHIFIECLQNLRIHTSDSLSDKKETIVQLYKTESGFQIITVNYIPNEKIDTLAGRIMKLKGMNETQLKDYYFQVLDNNTYSEKGGGGLGFIDMARKTNNNLDFNFLNIDDNYSFFKLKIKIDCLWKT